MTNDTNYWQRIISRRVVLRAAAVGGLGLSGAALIGCRSGGSKSASTPATGAGTAAANVGPQPIVSDGFVLIQPADLSSLDPLASQISVTPERIGLVYPRLIYVARENAEQADPKHVPSYAIEGWEVAGDGSRITFKLRKGVKYSNTSPVNGRELVAEDVKYSFNRYVTEPTSTFKARYTDIDAIESPDNYTVVFKLKKPSRSVLYGISAEP